MTVTSRVKIVRDLQFAAPGGCPLKADLYLPRGLADPVPLVVWVHGGGWRFGDRRLAPDLSRIYAQSGFAMASIDYRLSSQATFPAQLHDLKTAVRWLRSIAPSLGFDPARVGLLGSSAGGHLAALAALSGDAIQEEDPAYADYPSDVRAVVDAYGPTDFLQIDSHRLPDDVASEDPESLLLPAGITRSADPASYESLLLGAPIESCPDRVRLANPITYIGAGAPPLLILHGRSDTTVPPHQSELLYDALAASGNDVTFCLIDSLGHGFLNRTHLDEGPVRRMVVKRHVPGRGERVDVYSRPIFPLIEAFFRRHLMLKAPDTGRIAAAAGGPA